MEEQTKKRFYKRWWFWVLAVVVIFIIIGASSGSSTPIKVGSNDNVSAATNDTQQSVYKVGDQIKLGSSIITVNSVSISHGGQFTQPQAGNEWINLNVTIQNTGSSQQYVTTMGQMFVRDAQGNSYQVAVTDKVMENPNNSLDGAVIANSKRTGWVGFEVPQDNTGLQFQYNGSIFGGGTVVVDLGK